MATRCTIALDTPEGIRAIYCHWDGYPDENGVGEKLRAHWTTYETITALLDGGDLSSLGASLEDNNYYSARGEDKPATLFQSENEWYDYFGRCGCEYAYLFTNGEWIWKEI